MRVLIPLLTAVGGLYPSLAVGQEQADSQELAKKLANPIASLISVPFQFNWDNDYGPNDDGQRAFVNIQPVIPIDINKDWNVISRTILPVIWQNQVVPGAGSQFGLGDTTQSLFLSPQAPGPGGLIWGVGPVLLLPTATDDLLGGKKWGAGPTAVGLVQEGHWTVGMLGNHIWSYAGNDDRPDVSSTFLEPFVAYTTTDAWTFTLNTESTYNWETYDWSVPINLQVSKVLRFGKLPVSLGGGIRYWANSADNGPDGVGFRLIATALLPR